MSIDELGIFLSLGCDMSCRHCDWLFIMSTLHLSYRFRYKVYFISYYICTINIITYKITYVRFRNWKINSFAFSCIFRPSKLAIHDFIHLLRFAFLMFTFHLIRYLTWHIFSCSPWAATHILLSAYFQIHLAALLLIG